MNIVNKKMNKDTYALRSQVMGVIYEAKKLVPSLPRINVRITDTIDGAAGVASKKDCTIWIPAETCTNYDALVFKLIVLHEVLHAAYGVPHVKGCKLMNDRLDSMDGITSALLNKLFVKYTKQYGA